MKNFGFHDVHGFKDFIVEVIYGAPDDFMELDWLPPEEQLTLASAFEGLELGFHFVEKEFGLQIADEMRTLAREALEAYEAGNDLQGQELLKRIEKQLGKLNTN